MVLSIIKCRIAPRYKQVHQIRTCAPRKTKSEAQDHVQQEQVPKCPYCRSAPRLSSSTKSQHQQTARKKKQKPDIGTIVQSPPCLSTHLRRYRLQRLMYIATKNSVASRRRISLDGPSVQEPSRTILPRGNLVYEVGRPNDTNTEVLLHSLQ